MGQRAPGKKNVNVWMGRGTRQKIHDIMEWLDMNQTDSILTAISVLHKHLKEKQQKANENGQNKSED